jgi:hypothetical protein
MRRGLKQCRRGHLGHARAQVTCGKGESSNLKVGYRSWKLAAEHTGLRRCSATLAANRASALLRRRLGTGPYVDGASGGTSGWLLAVSWATARATSISSASV